MNDMELAIKAYLDSVTATTKCVVCDEVTYTMYPICVDCDRPEYAEDEEYIDYYAEASLFGDC